MEGVLVSAKRDDSTITTTVVSDSQGRYSFPRDRVEPGEYSLTIRAAGYEMDAVKVVVSSLKQATADLKLRKTQNLSAQLTTAEWLLSAPGTHEQKNVLLGCVICHTVERIFRSRHNADEFAKVRQRMGTYYEGTLPERPQLNPPRPAPPAGAAPPIPSKFTPAELEYLSTINLSSVSQWQYPLKTLPRPKGKATRMIVTQYDLPRKYAMPHDVVVGSDGIVWYSDHAQQLLGRLDSKTGNVVEYPLPVLKPGIPTGIHFLELDSDGDPWLSMGAQGGVARFDRKSQTFQTWTMPAGQDGDIYPNAYALLLGYLTVDGKIWVGEPVAGKIQRLDARSGEWDGELIRPYRDIAKDTPAATRSHLFYDIYADSLKNVYLTDISSGQIEKIDSKSQKVTFYETPTFDSGPRRAHMDRQDRLWFGEYSGNRIGMFNSKTEQFQEWELPTPFSGPYDAVLDKNGYVWTAGMTTDRVTRLNPKTGEMVEYLLPRNTNIRRVEVDNSANPDVFWAGDNHGSSILKLEPLE